LFGPVLTFDMARAVRKPHTHILRALYPAVLLLLTCAGLLGAVEHHLIRSHAQFSVAMATLPPQEMARFAVDSVYVLLTLQFALAVLVTPALVAPTVTREKERRTLEFLFAAGLGSAEIVLGKLFSRLGYLTYLLLSALPVFAGVQYFGGTAPTFVLACFAGTALTVGGLAGVSILISVLVRRSRDAILLSYFAAALYSVLCLAGQSLVDGGHLTTDPLFDGGPSAVDCVRALQAGNPVYALLGVDAGHSLSEALRDYAIFYALLAGSTVTLAVLRLRPVALREAGENKGRTRRRDLPPVGDRAVVWKERYCGGFKLPWWGKVLLLALVAWSFEPALEIGSKYASGTLPPGRTLSEVANEYVCHVSTYIACLLMLAAAVRGATAVHVEKDKGTLDALLTSPLSTREILFGKWVGCLWGQRWPALWLGAIYLVGVATGGLSLLALPLLAAALLVYFGCMALVGLLCSVGSPPAGSPSVAVSAVTAVTLSVVLWFMHWPLVAAALLAYRLAVPETAIGDILARFLAGMTPPAVLMTILPFTPEDWPGRHTAGNPGMLVRALIGLLYWAALARLLWLAAIKAFERVYNRGDVRSPDGLQKRRVRGTP
jgi:ABC-type transport system involved in multi-copper enzyme maturation permease subunit